MSAAKLQATGLNLPVCPAPTPADKLAARAAAAVEAPAADDPRDLWPPRPDVALLDQLMADQSRPASPLLTPRRTGTAG